MSPTNELVTPFAIQRSLEMMRSSLLLCALLVSRPSAIAVAQDYSPRHGFWMGTGLGFGPAIFTCDSCDSHRATANKDSQLGGWAISFGLGGTPNPRLRVGAEYDGWLHGLRKNDSLPEVELLSLLVAMYARDQGGPFLEVGAGFAHYSLVQGTGDPIEPVSKTANAFVSGGGAGFKLGVGWEFQSEFTPRIIYSLGREDRLTDGETTVAKAWTHQTLLLELGLRGSLNDVSKLAIRRRSQKSSHWTN